MTHISQSTLKSHSHLSYLVKYRDAKTLQTYKPGLEEGFGQKLRKVLLSKIKFYFGSIVLISVENKSSINT